MSQGKDAGGRKSTYVLTKICILKSLSIQVYGVLEKLLDDKEDDKIRRDVRRVTAAGFREEITPVGGLCGSYGCKISRVY